MTVGELKEWLEGVPDNCKVFLEFGISQLSDVLPLITAHVYDEDHDSELDTVYLIYK